MKSLGFISKVIMYVMMAISVILVLFSFAAGNEAALEDGSWTDMTIKWTYFMLGIGIIAAVVSAVFDAINNATSLLGTLVKLVVCAALVLLCWALSDDTPMNILGYEGEQNCYPWLNIADTSMFLCYIVLGGAIVAILYSELKNLFK